MPLRVTIAEDTPFAPIVEAAAKQVPDTLKLTSCPFSESPLPEAFDSAVAVTVRVDLDRDTELGTGPRTIVWPSASTAGCDGALCRGVGLIASGTTVVEMV